MAREPVKPKGLRGYWDSLLWRLLVCDECQGHGEMEYGYFPVVSMMRPGDQMISADEAAGIVRREACHTCGGTGRLTIKDRERKST